MRRFELIAPCHFGMEAVLKREILDLGYEITNVDNGKVTFEGDAEAIARANLFLRTTERILLKVAQLRRLHLMSCLRISKPFPGRNIFRRMANSG